MRTPLSIFVFSAAVGFAACESGGSRLAALAAGGGGNAPASPATSGSSPAGAPASVPAGGAGVGFGPRSAGAMMGSRTDAGARDAGWDDDAGPDNATSRASVATDAGPATAALATKCESITTDWIGLPSLQITQATSAAEQMANDPALSLPPHCVVTGKIGERTGIDGKSYAIGFELRLPSEWNRRFFFQGGGGSDGFILPATGVVSGAPISALGEGYAVVATDAGHVLELLPPSTGGVLFGVDPQARIDYGYAAVGTVTRVAKQIIERAYASAIRYSYFMGCSNGGRQAMVAAARFAEEFDGIVAGDPGYNLPKAAIQHAWNVQHLNTIDSDNSQAYSAAELSFVSEKILGQCDALDGASDGIVADLDGCKAAFDIGTAIPACSDGVRIGSCLTSAQKRALLAMVNGPVNSKGEPLYSDWPWDPSISTGNTFGDWRVWNTGTSGNNSFIRSLGGSSLAYVFTTPPVELDQDLLGLFDVVGVFLSNYDFDVDAPKVDAVSPPYTESAMSFMTPPNATHLDAFRARRGKLIVYHGSGDPVFSVNDTIRWYQGLQTDVPDASDFARLYIVPGMGHCAGGISTEVFDMMTPVAEWVERGIAPGTITARVDPNSANLPSDWSKTRTRPLCPYPQKTRLAPGATDLEAASSFVCQ